MNMEEKLTGALQALGTDEYKMIAVQDIVFSDLVFSQCKRNTCKSYDLNYACPPRSGTLEENKARIFHYKKGCVATKLMSIATSKDFNASRAAFKKYILDLRFGLEPYGFCILGEGPCSFCDRCAAVDGAPCRFPDKIRYSMEGSGIDVVRMSMNLDMTYNAGSGKIGFFALILYND
jgi:predicted metal-binding protein